MPPTPPVPPTPPASPAPPSSPRPTPPAKLRLTGLSLSPRALGARGATLRFRLTRAARVTLVVERLRNGRLRGTRCKPTRTAGKGKRCVRYVAAGRLTVDGEAGANRIALSRRIGRTTLPAARYRLRAIASGNGQRAPERQLRFRVKPAARR